MAGAGPKPNLWGSEMATNDEINWEKNEPIISKYGIQTWRNGKRTPEHLVSVTHTGVSLNNMLNEARDDTANEIFAKLDKVVWQQLEASRLKEFLIQFSNAKDEEAALKVATAFSIIGLDAEKYEALKKQYKVD